MGLHFLAILTILLASFFQACLPEVPRTAPGYYTEGVSKTSYQEETTPAPQLYSGPKRRVAILPVEGNIDYMTGRRAEEILKRITEDAKSRLVGAGADNKVIKSLEELFLRVK